MAAKLSSKTSGFAGYLQQVKGGAIGFASPAGTAGVSYNPTAMGTGLIAVGIISGPIEFNLNPATVKIFASVLRGPYDEITTQVDPQLTFSVDQYSMWNLALGMSLEQDAVSGSSLLRIDMQYLKQDGSSAAGLTGNAVANAGFHCCELLTNAPAASAAGANGTQAYQFWKVKVFSNGAIAFSGDALTQIPLRVQCFSNDSDQIGQVDQNIAHTNLAYET